MARSTSAPARAALSAIGRRSDRLALVLEPEAEHRLQIVGGELLESDHRLGPLDAVQLGQTLRDDFGELVVLTYTGDGDEVPFACHCVDLRDPFHVSQPRAEAREPVARGLDQDHRGQHQALFRCTTAPVASPYAHTSISPYSRPWWPSTVQMWVRW